jgi:hypothetical protein
MIAAECKYHLTCLLGLYYKAARASSLSSSDNTNEPTDSRLNTDSLALAQVIAYLENARCTEVTPSVFKLSDLATMYASAMGIESSALPQYTLPD